MTIGFGHELLVPTFSRKIFDVSQLGDTESPGPARSRVFDGSLNLGVGEISFNVKHLSWVNEVRVLDLVAVSLKK